MKMSKENKKDEYNNNPFMVVGTAIEDIPAGSFVSLDPKSGRVSLTLPEDNKDK